MGTWYWGPGNEVLLCVSPLLPRVPEIVFQPTMVGVDQCGLLDTMEYILQTYPADIQQRLVNVRKNQPSFVLPTNLPLAFWIILT